MTDEGERGRQGWPQEGLLDALEGYRQGVAEAPCIFKWNALGAVAVRAEDRGTGTMAPGDHRADVDGREDESDGRVCMTFVASTEDVDRHGDVVSVSGWRLDAYRKNPVFLWAHDYSRPAIGRCTAVWTAPGEAGRGPALLARVEFAPTAFAQEVASLYRGGYQKGVSVGFRPLRYEERRHPQTGQFLGIRFTEQALLEVSAAPVPANENAVRRGQGGGLPWLQAQDGRAAAGMESRLDRLERWMEATKGQGGLASSDLPQLMEVLRSARG